MGDGTRGGTDLRLPEAGVGLLRTGRLLGAAPHPEICDVRLAGVTSVSSVTCPVNPGM